MNDIEKIKVIHDYIINNANYDTSLEKLKYSEADDVLLYKLEVIYLQKFLMVKTNL